MSQHNPIHKAIYILLGLFIIYALVGIYSAQDSLKQALVIVPWRQLPQIIGLVMVGWLVRAARWHYYTKQLKWHIKWYHNLHAFLASSALTATPGKAGELVKSSLLQTHYPIKTLNVAGLLLVERLTDLLAVIVLAIGGINLFPAGKPYFAICGACILLSTVWLATGLYNPVLQLLLPLPFIGKLAAKIKTLLTTSQQVLKPIPLFTGLSLAVIAWSCEALALYQLLNQCQIHISLLTAGCLFGTATLVGALSFLPGGIGSFEVVMVLILIHEGFTTTRVMPPIIIFRFITLWLGCFLGIILFLFWPICYASKAKQKS